MNAALRKLPPMFVANVVLSLSNPENSARNAVLKERVDHEEEYKKSLHGFGDRLYRF